MPEPILSREDRTDPEHEALLADSVGPALLVVLETLSPAERLAFVLHDMFGVPFEESAPIVGRSPNAGKMLASRARRRVQGVAPVPNADLTRQRRVVDAFLAASHDGDFEALLTLLDPDVVLRADRAAVDAGAPGEIRGAPAVADTFSGRARYAQLALVNGAVGAVWAPGGRPRLVFGFTVTRGQIVKIDILAGLRDRLLHQQQMAADGQMSVAGGTVRSPDGRSKTTPTAPRGLRYANNPPGVSQTSWPSTASSHNGVEVIQ